MVVGVLGGAVRCGGEGGWVGGRAGGELVAMSVWVGGRVGEFGFDGGGELGCGCWMEGWLGRTNAHTRARGVLTDSESVRTDTSSPLGKTKPRPEPSEASYGCPSTTVKA